MPNERDDDGAIEQAVSLFLWGLTCKGKYRAKQAYEVKNCPAGI